MWVFIVNNSIFWLSYSTIKLYYNVFWDLRKYELIKGKRFLISIS